MGLFDGTSQIMTDIQQWAQTVFIAQILTVGLLFLLLLVIIWGNDQRHRHHQSLIRELRALGQQGTEKRQRLPQGK